MNKMAVIVFALLLTVGCGSIGMMASDTKNFTGRDILTLKTTRPDILELISETGKSLGYSVSGFDREFKRVSLSSGSSFFTTVMIGKVNRSTLTISVEEDGQKLGITVTVWGNFGAAGQEAATQLIDDFKKRLLEKIGEK